MLNYPNSIQNLINQFSKLPGIGAKTAERLVFYILKMNNNDIIEFSESLKSIKNKIIQCGVCFNYSESNPCKICANQKRDKSILCLVARSQDVIAIERIGNFQGLYHVLGGNFNPLEGISMDDLTTKELLARIKNDSIKEIILALNPDIEGETTSLALLKILKPLNIKITRLARGLPMGSDLEYADEVTLRNAIDNRKEI